MRRVGEADGRRGQCPGGRAHGLQDGTRAPAGRHLDLPVDRDLACGPLGHGGLGGDQEASEAGDWKRANEQEKILETQLAENTALLQKINRELNPTR